MFKKILVEKQKSNINRSICDMIYLRKIRSYLMFTQMQNIIDWRILVLVLISIFLTNVIIGKIYVEFIEL